MPVLPPHTTTSQEHAVVLYEFSSDDPEELAVSEGDRVLVLDKSDPEWWQVQLSPPHGRAGLVPASYLELQPASLRESLDTEYEPPAAAPAKVISTPPLPTRTETVRRAASRAHIATPAQPVPLPSAAFATPSQASDSAETPPASRRAPSDSDNMPLHLLQIRQAQQTEMPRAAAAVPAPILEGPDMSKVRTWTDGSGAYTVEAQFLRLDPDGQVHLHKTNNKKITVDLAKFSAEDRQYVEGVTGTSIPPAMPAKSMTARQRQQESARKHPERRPINYDWDWFDFFTLKGGVSADNSLKYATSFVAERLDDESIPEITANTMRTLGVKPADIPKILRAFRLHQGLPADDVDSMADDNMSQQARQEPRPVLGSPSWAQQPARSPRVSSPKPAPESTSRAQPPRRAANNPWGIDSELDRRSDRRKQIDSDEALARRMQEEEQHKPHGKKNPNARKQTAAHGPAPDPFTSLDVPVASSSAHRPAGPHSATAATSKLPLNLAAGSRKPAKAQTSVVDPAQLRSVQQKLGGSTSPSPAPDGGAAGPSGRTAMDDAFGTGGASRSPPPPQQQEQARNLPPRSRPIAARNQPNITANMAPLIATPQQQQQQQMNLQGMGELTTQRMAVAAATGNTAQIDHLEQMAKAKAQELAVQETRIKQQQEEIRQQTMFLQQQQQQLLQMQQTQKVEAQLKQLKEDKERLETQRQAEAMKQQVEMLKAQQEQMLRMQQMATQARGLQAAAAAANSGSAHHAPISAPVNMPVPLQQQPPLQQMSMMGANTSGISSIAGGGGGNQIQQAPVSLSRRLPPPLIPSQMSKPVTLQSNQANS
ncbi:cytoskeletal protein binding protein, partial [Coemansia sp. RSA 2424]